MKVRVTKIYEDAVYVGDGLESPKEEPKMANMVIAELESRKVGFYTTIRVPVEMVADAKIGDEFTLHLERAKK